MKRDIICIVDGGYNDKHVDKGYGSFAVKYNGRTQRSNIFELPVNTSNEAEYYSFLILLDYILKRNDINDHLWIIISDSQLMVNQVNGKSRTEAKNLIPLRKMAKEMIGQIPKVKLKWNCRKRVKKVLGH